MDSIDVDNTDSRSVQQPQQPETHATARTRQTTSNVWNDFLKEVVNGVPKAKCKHCGKSLSAKPKDGTSHLRAHLDKKHLLKVKKDVRQMLLNAGEKKHDGKMELKPFMFDQSVSRRDLARMIILHEYPFSIVDHVGFREFCRNMQPLFNVVTRNTIKKDCMQVYEEEREKLYSLLESLHCRVSLTTDMWTSDQNKGYFCLSAHYIDHSWKLHKRILNFSAIDAPHTASALSKAILDRMFKWNIDRKLMSIVVDNCSTNDAMIRELLSKLSSHNLIGRGCLLHARCSAHIINLIVQKGTGVVADLLVKVRESVKFVKSSTLRLQNFKEVSAQVKAPNKSLILDVPTRWNSTFMMLQTALQFKDAFSRLALVDPNYNHEPTLEEWQNISCICSHLKFFYDVTRDFSMLLYPSANYFFSHICAIKVMLLKLCNSTLSLESDMGKSMVDKFDKYWDNTHMVLSIASVFDPRHKMETVDFWMRKIYGVAEGDRRIDDIKTLLVDMYEEYRIREGNIRSGLLNSSESLSSCVAENGSSSASNSYAPALAESLAELDQYLAQKSAGQSLKNDLELYLDEAVHPKQEKFDILVWWSLNAAKFPIVACMARDVLAIPASSVASESAFSTGGRVLDQYRCSMHPSTLESLICSQDWIRNELKGEDLGDAIIGSIKDACDDQLAVKVKDNETE